MKHTSKKSLEQKESRNASASASSTGNAKGKDSRQPKMSDASDEYSISFREFKTVDKSKLSRYVQILKRSDGDMITMDDLDSLQLELETLLSAVAVRLIDLNSEIETLSTTDETIKEKKVKVTSGKATTKKGDERSTIKISKPAKESSKVSNSLVAPPTRSKSKGMPLAVEEEAINDHVIPDTSVSDQSKLLLPKNDAPNKFWAFVDDYCTEITQDDIKFVEDLKASCEKDVDLSKIPPLGKHYTLRWSDEDLNEERDSSGVIKLKRKSADSSSSGTNTSTVDNQLINNNNSGSKELLKKAEKVCIGERIPGPLAQRLVSALLEENLFVTPLQDNVNIQNADKQTGTTADQESECPAKRQKTDSSNSSAIDTKGGENTMPTFVKKLPMYHTSICFERRLRRGLETLGFIDTQHPPPEENDEILKEIKKCQEELRKCAAHNVGQLKRVLEVAQSELKRNDFRKKMRHVDSEVIEVYRRLTAAKLKNKQISKKEREQAWNILQERESLQKCLHNSSSS